MAVIEITGGSVTTQLQDGGVLYQYTSFDHQENQLM
jgi:hypothetical protein